MVAEIMVTGADTVHLMGVPSITADGLNVAHVQIEYLPTDKRTEAFIKTASDRIGDIFARLLNQDILVRSWPTNGVAMAQITHAVAR